MLKAYKSALLLGLIIMIFHAASECAMSSVGIPQGKALENLVASTPRPFVLLNRQELDNLCRSVRTDDFKRKIYLAPGKGENDPDAGILTIANRWVNADITIPKRGGHAHFFFCDCGTELILPDDLEPRPEYVCPNCGRTYSGERYDAAVRLYRHHMLSNISLYLSLAYCIENNCKYADKAAEILHKYAEAYPGPHTSTLEGGMIYQSLNEATWIIPLAQAYDLIYDSGSLTDADKHLIETHLFHLAAEGIKSCGIGGNWGSWHLSAVGVIGFAIRNASLVQFALDAFRSQIKNQLGDDGLWPESVHTYHFYPLTAFVYFAEACEHAGIDLYNWEAKPGKSLKSMFTAPLEYMYPNFQLPAINDGWYSAYLPMNLYEAAYKAWHNPMFAWVLENGYAAEAGVQINTLSSGIWSLQGVPLYHFLLGRKNIERTAAPVFTSTNYTNFGLCTLRNNQTMLTFHYGKFLGHGHLDKLSFTLYSHDTPMISDYGTPGYGSKVLGWYKSTASHNTVVVDGKSQKQSTNNKIDAFFPGRIAQYAQSTANDCYPGVSHTRKMLLFGDACFIVDDLTSDQEHCFDWLVHCEGYPRVVDSHTEADIDLSAYPDVTFGRMEQMDDFYRVNWTTIKCQLALGIWSKGAQVALGKCRAESDARQISMLVCRNTGCKARFVSVMLPIKTGGVSELSRVGDLFEASTGDAEYYFSSSPESHGKLTTDAKLAVVCVQNNKVAAAALVQGSKLNWNGVTLINHKSSAEYVEEDFESGQLHLISFHARRVHNPAS